jgi:hypothetical protein
MTRVTLESPRSDGAKRGNIGSGDASPCPECGVAPGRLLAVTAERDRLLRAVAMAEERANALLLSYPVPPDRQSPAGVPTQATVDRTPLRHRLVDLLNSEIKRTLGPAHRGAKRLGQAVLLWSSARKRRREP